MGQSALTLLWSMGSLEMCFSLLLFCSFGFVFMNQRLVADLLGRKQLRRERHLHSCANP